MAYRAYPRADRARHQLDRHNDEWAPGGPFPPPLALPANWEPPRPAPLRLSADQVAAFAEAPLRMRQSAVATLESIAVSLQRMRQRNTA